MSNNDKGRDKDDIHSDVAPFCPPSFGHKEVNMVEGQLTIKTITGTSFSVDLCPSASVSILKTLIEVCRGIP